MITQKYAADMGHGEICLSHGESYFQTTHPRFTPFCGRSVNVILQSAIRRSLSNMGMSTLGYNLYFWIARHRWQDPVGRTDDQDKDTCMSLFGIESLQYSDGDGLQIAQDRPEDNFIFLCLEGASLCSRICVYSRSTLLFASCIDSENENDCVFRNFFLQLVWISTSFSQAAALQRPQTLSVCASLTFILGRYHREWPNI